MEVKKAGCVLVDKKNKKIGLIYRQKQQDYSFPKGHMEKGETLIECAIRETIEETKRECEIVLEEPLMIEKYIDSNGHDVVMYYYLAIDKGPSDNACEDTHNLIWTDLDMVEKTLSYESLKIVWNQIKNDVYKLIQE